VSGAKSETTRRGEGNVPAICETCGVYEAFEDQGEMVCDGCKDYCSQCERACGRPDAPESAPEPEYELCPQCRGSGKMVHRALSVWTQEDRYADPDGFEDMMRGCYDVVCDRCNGLRVVTVESEREFSERRQDHFTMLREQGIYPGNPDYF